MDAAMILGKFDCILVNKRDLQLFEECHQIALRIADAISAIGTGNLNSFINILDAFDIHNFAALRAVEVRFVMTAMRAAARDCGIDEPCGEGRIHFGDGRVIAFFAGSESSCF